MGKILLFVFAGLIYAVEPPEIPVVSDGSSGQLFANGPVLIKNGDELDVMFGSDKKNGYMSYRAGKNGAPSRIETYNEKNVLVETASFSADGSMETTQFLDGNGKPTNWMTYKYDEVASAKNNEAYIRITEYELNPDDNKKTQTGTSLVPATAALENNCPECLEKQNTFRKIDQLAVNSLEITGGRNNTKACTAGGQWQEYGSSQAVKFEIIGGVCAQKDCYSEEKIKTFRSAIINGASCMAKLGIENLKTKKSIAGSYSEFSKFKRRDFDSVSYLKNSFALRNAARLLMLLNGKPRPIRLVCNASISPAGRANQKSIVYHSGGRYAARSSIPGYAAWPSIHFRKSNSEFASLHEAIHLLGFTHPHGAYRASQSGGSYCHRGTVSPYNSCPAYCLQTSCDSSTKDAAKSLCAGDDSTFKDEKLEQALDAKYKNCLREKQCEKITNKSKKDTCRFNCISSVQFFSGEGKAANRAFCSKQSEWASKIQTCTPADNAL